MAESKTLGLESPAVRTHIELMQGVIQRMADKGRVGGVDEEDLARKARADWLKYRAGVVAWDPAQRTSAEIYPPLLPIRARE